MKPQFLTSVVVFLSLFVFACGGTDSAKNAGGGDGPGGDRRGGMMGGGAPAAVPVQVQPVQRRSISQHLETNGTLEAENEVDLVARTSGPVTAILAEEGELVRKGQLMATIDDREARNQVAIATVARNEAQLAFDRASSSWTDGLVSKEAHDTARSKLDSTTAQLESAELQLAYTRIEAPFDALVVTRNIKLAQHVGPGETLFRISDFVPLLCRVEIPEKDLSRIKAGQPAHLRVEAFPDERFSAAVARLRPTVDAATGTFTVTLEVDGQARLIPGMFASVYLETDTHDDALVIPRKALVLDSLGDTVFVRVEDQAVRREVELGLRDEDAIEIVAGLSAGDELIVLGQDGLAEGTPVTVLGEPASPAENAPRRENPEGPSPEMIETMRASMKERGMSDEQIEERLGQIRSGEGPGVHPPGGGPGAGGIPPQLAERIRNASPEELETIKERMKSFGMPNKKIEETITSIRGTQPQ